MELEYNAYPAVRATPPEQSLSTWLDVRFSVEGMFDGQHDIQQRIRDLRVSPAHMVPGFEVSSTGRPSGPLTSKYMMAELGSVGARVARRIERFSVRKELARRPSVGRGS
jgi:hypothetical protein